MSEPKRSLARRISTDIAQALGRIEFLALFPLFTLIAVWLELGDAVIVTAFLLPALLAISSLSRTFQPATLSDLSVGTNPYAQGSLSGREALMAMIDRVSSIRGHDSACILLQIDDWEAQIDRWGPETTDEIAERVSDRLCTALRFNDLVVRLGDARFGVVLHPIRAARLGMREAVVGRLRATIAEPIAVGGASVSLTACVGHTSLIRENGAFADATLAAAEAALVEAHRQGPDAVRAFSTSILQSRRDRSALTDEVEGALAAGEIRPWFQPQICTDTGVISGFEALARWHHPRRGLLAPGEFLDAIDDAGRMEELGHVILIHSLTALQKWDNAGLRVPSVSVNFSAIELRNLGLADRVKWEIDRFDLRPARLTVEILETVAAEASDEAVSATISALRVHGINLDLDDFGIGQASLSAIRRFGVNRIKIDQSFIIGMDGDPEQQATVAAILSMAQHLGVETLAEGVETAEVHSMLAQMGCDHLQGFHLARPMPFEDTIVWATEHNGSLAQVPMVGRRAG